MRYSIVDFKSKASQDKINFLIKVGNTDNVDFRQLQLLLKEVIFNDFENPYIKKNALNLFIENVLIGNIKDRQALTLLIDEWKPTDDLFINLQRLKDLFYFYDLEPTEIENIYFEAKNSDNLEVVSESLYNLGLISMQKGFFLNNKEEFIVEIEKAKLFFKESSRSIENRKDSEFYLLVTDYILNISSAYYQAATINLSDMSSLLFKMISSSINQKIDSFYIGFYRILFALSKIISEDPDNWLDFRSSIIKLFNKFSEIQNQLIYERLNKSIMALKFKETIKVKYINPFFTVNFHAQLSKIEVMKSECKIESDEYNFLEELGNTVSSKQSKKKDEAASIEQRISNIYHYIDPQRKEDILSKMDITNLNSILTGLEELHKFSIENLIDKLVTACIKLQGNKIYRGNFSEDDRNTFIANILEANNFQVKDQTRWSKSATGINAGEIDILIYDNNHMPFTIIEALNLDSLKKEYVKLHLDKLFDYDTAGFENNIILIYSNAVGFDSLWQKYCEYICSYDFKYQYSKFIEYESYADIRKGRTTHLRNSKNVYLYHIMLNLYD